MGPIGLGFISFLRATGCCLGKDLGNFLSDNKNFNLIIYQNIILLNKIYFILMIKRYF